MIEDDLKKEDFAKEELEKLKKEILMKLKGC